FENGMRLSTSARRFALIPERARSSASSAPFSTASRNRPSASPADTVSSLVLAPAVNFFAGAVMSSRGQPALGWQGYCAADPVVKTCGPPSPAFARPQHFFWPPHPMIQPQHAPSALTLAVFALHIAGGTVALVSGTIAAFAAKGGRLHRHAGNVFF